MSISDYEARTVPVSDAEISFLAEIFMEIMTAGGSRRKDDNNEPDHKEI